MSGKREIETIIEQRLGEKNSSRLPFLDALGKKGIYINELTVAGLRNDRTSGNALLERLKANEILEGRRKSEKTQFIVKMAQFGMEIRSYQSGPNSHKLLSDGFTQDIATNLGVRLNAVKCVIRSVRLDLVYSEAKGEYKELPDIFLKTANEYFKAFVENKGTVSNPPARRISEEWNRRTMKDFYRLLNTLGVRTRSTWFPYEVAIFNKLYQDKQKAGDLLTSLDGRILVAYRDKNSHPFAELVSEVEESIGMKINSDSLEAYKSILIHGWPIPPSKLDSSNK